MSSLCEGRMDYPSKPFDCWGMVKELRQKNFEEVMTARERGAVVATGGTGGGWILAGLGDHVYLPGEPYGAEISLYPELAVKCAAAVEERGYARDLCGYLRMYWGLLLLNPR